MSQTNAIILRIARNRTKEFEALFEAEQYPHWKEMHAKGQMLAASLTRVEYGSESDDAQQGKYVNYVVVAKLTGQEAHDAHNDDPRFKEYDRKADAFQPEGPSVYGGTTIFEVGGGPTPRTRSAPRRVRAARRPPRGRRRGPRGDS